MIRINKELLGFVTSLYESQADGRVSKIAIPPRELVLEQGEWHPYVYVLESGIAKCYLTEENGNEFIQEFFGEGSLCGELEVFIDDEPYCSIEAITEVTAYRFAVKDFSKLVSENPAFSNLLVRTLVAKVKYKGIRLSFNQSNLIEKKLLYLSSQFPEFLETISRRNIANYLGINKRSLSRSLKSLREKDLID